MFLFQMVLHTPKVKMRLKMGHLNLLNYLLNQSINQSIREA